MTQDPEYLRMQSKRLHALYRRNRRFLNVWVLLWTVCFTVLFGAAVLDRVGAYGWGYSDDLWAFVAFVLFAPCFWTFSTLIMKFNIAYVRHTYGPEPKD